jgi:hypothetical protein
MLKKVPRDVALRCWPDLAAKSSHAGVDVDGLACHLPRPTAYSRQTIGRDFLRGAVLFHCVAMGGDALLGVVKPRVWIFVEVLIGCVPVS